MKLNNFRFLGSATILALLSGVTFTGFQPSQANDAYLAESTLQSVLNDKCLYTGHGGSDNVMVVPCDRGKRYGKRWKLTKNRQLQSALNGKCLYTGHGGSDDVMVVPCDRGKWQGKQWKLNKNSQLQSVLNGKCLYTGHGGSDNVMVVPCDRGKWQGKKWDGALLSKYSINQDTADNTDEQKDILPVALPTSETKGASTWKIDERGGITGSITYTVGSGSGSKKYSSGVVVEFLDGSTYYAETTKTVGRPISGTNKGTHTVNASSIPLDKVNQIRRVFVNDGVDKGLDTIREWKDLVVNTVVEADADYQKLKELGLVQDAGRAAAGS